MMDPQRLEQIDRGAKYVKSSNGEWRKIHSDFLNAQFELSDAFYHRLSRQPGGKKKIIELFGIKNMDAVPWLR